MARLDYRVVYRSSPGPRNTRSCRTGKTIHYFEVDLVKYNGSEIPTVHAHGFFKSRQSRLYKSVKKSVLNAMIVHASLNTMYMYVSQV